MYILFVPHQPYAVFLLKDADIVDFKNRFSASAAILFGGRCRYFQRALKMFSPPAVKPKNIVNSP